MRFTKIDMFLPLVKEQLLTTVAGKILNGQNLFAIGVLQGIKGPFENFEAVKNLRDEEDTQRSVWTCSKSVSQW